MDQLYGQCVIFLETVTKHQKQNAFETQNNGIFETLLTYNGLIVNLLFLELLTEVGIDQILMRASRQYGAWSVCRDVKAGRWQRLISFCS
jgi:hypothetical protein